MQRPISRRSPPSRGAPAPRLSSYFMSGLLVSAMALLAPAWAGGCRDGGLPGDCVGGVIVDDVCQGKCTPDKCAYSDNTCVGNKCVLECDSHLDCQVDGSQVCGPAKEDDTNADITVCVASGKPAGIGVACPAGTECADWLSCPDGTGCRASQCSGDSNACVIDNSACKEKGSACTIGKCPDGSACRVDCQASCTAWLACESKGEADASAYCTQRDCAGDADCLDGYYCGIVRDPHAVCGSNPTKGNNSLCGETAEDCKSPGDGGTTLFEGSICMLRRSCLKRGQAAPCAADSDCSWIDEQECHSLGGETRCTRTCYEDADCQADSKCEPPAAGSQDGTPGACVPRFGAWIGGPAKFCEPCLDDEDCGKKGTSWYCADLADGMRGCFDGSYSTACATDAECPASPSGKHGSCLDERFGVDSGDPKYHHCDLPLDPMLGTASCW